MDPFPPNVERIAAAPFSLDAARRRHPLADAATATSEAAAPIDSAPQGSAPRPRRHPRLELIAGSAVPDPTPTQITDARERFLNQTVRSLTPTPIPTAALITAGQPSMALLRRIPRLLPGRDVPGEG